MLPVPPHLADGFPEVARGEIEAWWASLTDPRREQVTHLCDERHDKCVFGIIGSEEMDVHVEQGHFMPDEEMPDNGDAWNEDRYEYLMNHPELIVAWDLLDKKIHHVCSAHAGARQCLREGFVPANLRCPFSSAELKERTGGGATCLMDPFRGRQIRFVPNRVSRER